MYSENFYKIFHLEFLLASGIGVCSFQFNRRTRLLYATPALKRRCLLSSTFTAFHIFFHAGSTLQMVMYGGDSDSHFYIRYIYTIVSVLEFCGVVIVKWNEDDILHVINQLMRYIVNFYGNKAKLLTMPLLKSGCTINFISGTPKRVLSTI